MLFERRMMIIFSLLFWGVIYIAGVAQAVQVQLAWDPPVNEDGSPVDSLAGYKLYYGNNSRNYPYVIDVGNQTTFILDGLTTGQPYFFAVTAYDQAGNESEFSEEINTTFVDNTPPSPAPPSNLLTNGDIEGGIWSNGTFSGTQPVRSWATDFSHSATHSLKMTDNKYFYGYWTAESVPVTPGEEYELSMWVKTASITNGVFLNIEWYDASNRWLSWISGVGGKVTGTNDWQRIQGTVIPPTNARTAKIQIRIESSGGTAWIDDVVLRSLKETEPDPPPDSDPPADNSSSDPVSGPDPADDTSDDSLSDPAQTDPPPAPAVALSANPESIKTGESVTLNWTVTNVTSCTAAGGWSGSFGSSNGSASLFPLETTTYEMICDGPGGGASSSVTVTVEENSPPIEAPAEVEQYRRWEATLTSSIAYVNPFTEVTLQVLYTHESGQTLTGYGFWDGGKTFKIRMAFPTLGRWYYKTVASDPTNSGLHNQEGSVDVIPYTGDNLLYRHGPLQVSPSQRALVHADGTPFFWLADTLWGATVWLSEAGFKQAIDSRRAQHFTVLQTNFARKAEVDTDGNTPWDGDRWNVAFMQKLDRLFDYANDQGMYLFVNGLIDLVWERNIANYQRLVEMIAIRYSAHHLSFSASMDDPYSPQQDELNTLIHQVAPHLLLTQHPGSATNGEGNVWTAEQYFDKAYLDYSMIATGTEGDLELSCQRAIEWILQLYNRTPSKPIVNGETWYEGLRGGTGEIAVHLAYLSLLSGAVGYSYGTALWNATDADLSEWATYPGATYLQYLAEFFSNLKAAWPFTPRHDLIRNQATRYQEKMVVGVSQDGNTYVAFLPYGGTLQLDLTGLIASVGVQWYNPLTGQYVEASSTPGGTVQTFTSPFGATHSVLVLTAESSLSADIVSIWLEAEIGQLTSPLEIQAVDTASTGQYIWVPENASELTDPTQPGGEASYPLSIPEAGTYALWGRLQPNAAGTGAFFFDLVVADDSSASSAPAEPGTVTDLLPTTYQVASLQVGDPYYLDRSYVLTALPNFLQGQVGIKTRNNDKYNTQPTFLSFTLNQPATLYVAYDTQGTEYPAWLTSTFTPIEERVYTTDVPLSLWRREVPAGPVSLPGNFYGSPAGVASNYIVFIDFHSEQGAEAVADYYPWEFTLSSSPSEGTLILTDLLPTTYQVASLQVGDPYYLDRSYVLTALPNFLQGQVGIKTRNNDKYNTQPTFLSFTLNQPATLYVAYDTQGTEYPAWLTSTFTPIEERVYTTDVPLSLWRREVPAGPVSLPGNFYGSPAGVASNYIVFVIPSATGQETSWIWLQAPLLFELEAGEYRLRLKQKIAGTKLDRLLITNDLAFVP